MCVLLTPPLMPFFPGRLSSRPGFSGISLHGLPRSLLKGKFQFFKFGLGSEVLCFQEAWGDAVTQVPELHPEK